MDELQKLMQQIGAVRRTVETLPAMLKKLSPEDFATAQQSLRIMSGEMLQPIAHQLFILSSVESFS